jgi:hypothetical protein
LTDVTLPVPSNAKNQATAATASNTPNASRLYGSARIKANAERSHAGPLALDCNRDALPALADATGWASSSNLNPQRPTDHVPYQPGFKKYGPLYLPSYGGGSVVAHPEHANTKEQNTTMKMHLGINCLTKKLRHAGPLSREKQEGETRRRLKRLVKAPETHLAGVFRRSG